MIKKILRTFYKKIYPKWIKEVNSFPNIASYTLAFKSLYGAHLDPSDFDTQIITGYVCFRNKTTNEVIYDNLIKKFTDNPNSTLFIYSLKKNEYLVDDDGNLFYTINPFTNRPNNYETVKNRMVIFNYLNRRDFALKKILENEKN